MTTKREGEDDDHPLRVDKFDAMLAINRQQIILHMINQGQLDPEEGIKLFEATTRPDQIEKDRKALDEGEFGPDSPSGILGTLFFKLKRNKPHPNE